jgi:hypothetical protein
MILLFIQILIFSILFAATSQQECISYEFSQEEGLEQED